MTKEEKELKQLLGQEKFSKEMLDPEVGMYYFHSIDRQDVSVWIKNKKSKYIKIIKELLELK